MENIGYKIYKLRKEKHISQEDLGGELGVARQTVSKWELGEAQPTIENVYGMCNFFGVEIDYFYGNVRKEEAIAKSETESATAQIEGVTATEIQIAETATEKPASKFKTLKICSVVAGMVLLVFLIIGCGIGAYVTISPDEGQYVQSYHSINYVGIVLLVLGTVAAAIFITLLILFVIRRTKNRQKKQNVNLK